MELTYDIVDGTHNSPFAQLSISFFVLKLLNLTGDRSEAQQKERLRGEKKNFYDQIGEDQALVREPGDHGERHGVVKKMLKLDLQVGDRNTPVDENSENSFKQSYPQIDQIANVLGLSDKYFGLLHVQLKTFAENI